MHKYLIRLVVFLLAALTGTAVTGIRNLYHKQAKWPRAEAQIQGAIIPGPALSESENDELPKSLSPFDIKFFINDHPQGNLTKLWQALGIDPHEFQEQKINGPYFPASCQNRQAESFEYDLDGEPGTEVLLRIARPWDPAARYLIFKYVSDKWKLLGHIDASAKYRAPQHTIILSGGLTWLAIQSQGASGSGVASYFDRVFLVTTKGVLEVFSYISEGHQSGPSSDANREFNGRIVNCTLVNDVVTVEMEYSVVYFGGDDILFKKKQKAIFTKALGSETERFDRQSSNLSKDELEAVYNIDSLSDEGILKYNYQELSQIAAGQNVSKKEWLREFLKHCENTLEHRRLSQLLAQ